MGRLGNKTLSRWNFFVHIIRVWKRIYTVLPTIELRWLAIITATVRVISTNLLSRHILIDTSPCHVIRKEHMRISNMGLHLNGRNILPSHLIHFGEESFFYTELIFKNLFIWIQDATLKIKKKREIQNIFLQGDVTA